MCKKTNPFVTSCPASRTTPDPQQPDSTQPASHTPHHHGCCTHCCEAESHEEEHHHHHDMNYRQWMAIACSAGLLLTALTLHPFPQMPWLIYIAAYLPVGVPILREAFHEMQHGDVFNEFTLMLIATAGAFAIGEYPEAIAVLLLYSIGEYFQGLAVGNAQRDIRSLVSLRPDSATVIDPQGNRKQLSPEEVSLQSIIEVKAGERVPLDSRLLYEAASFDAAALTGESVPRTLQPGEEVPAGFIATGGPVRLQVIRPYTESALQRILTMVQDASRHKSHAERFIRRFAHIYTPAVTLLAAGIAVLPPFLGLGTWNEWLYRALVFLVISCPCALVISIPLCYFRGIGIASRHGILFKGGNYLDAVTRLRQVIFDKTGTLTAGRFGVVSITAEQGFTETEVLHYTAALERHSTHPLAQALTEKAGITLLKTTEQVEEHSGKGIRGLVDGHEVVVGQADFLCSHHIDFETRPNASSPYTFVYCAIDGRAAGQIALSDQPREDAHEAISRLYELGIHQTVMLSGDRKEVVQALAHELGISRAYGQLLPEDKANLFRQLKSETCNGLTAFVGDGINDAPVLALSDVGIAMGQGGSDAAVETADIVIHNSRPSSVADAILIGRNTRRIVCQNIVMAIGLKVAILLLGGLGYTGLWAAVLADTGVALLCVANTYRIRK